MKTIEGMLSFDECRASIEFHAHKINSDVFSTWINQSRIESLRTVLDLFEEYNQQLRLEQKENLGHGASEA